MRLEGVEWDCPSARLIPAMRSKKQGRVIRDAHSANFEDVDDYDGS